MQVFVLADERGKDELLLKKTAADAQFIFGDTISQLQDNSAADAFFILKEDLDIKKLISFTGKPVLINSATATLTDLNLPNNVSRIIGWPTFLNHDIWDIATVDETLVKNIFDRLQWKYSLVKDVPGLISARIISMIVNEAYFALGDDVSSKKEIDLAMKLGTNYPFGPFEWSEKIGLEKIYGLLQKLSETDGRYNIAPAMKNELFKT